MRIRQRELEQHDRAPKIAHYSMLFWKHALDIRVRIRLVMAAVHTRGRDACSCCGACMSAGLQATRPHESNGLEMMALSFTECGNHDVLRTENDSR